MNDKRELDSEILRDFIQGKLPDHLSKCVEDCLSHDPNIFSQIDSTDDDSFIVALRQVAQGRSTSNKSTDRSQTLADSLPDVLAISPKLKNYQFTSVLKCHGQITTALAIHRHANWSDERDADRKVVVRLIKAKSPWLIEEVQRFRGEVETLRMLQHPNVVAYVESEVSDRAAFLAMQFIEGVDLAKMVAEFGPIPYGAVAFIAVHLLEALQYLEQQKVVHRDIKPSNIVLGTDGVARLIDFGLAKRISGEQDHSLTRSEYFLGTLDYISPEQAIESRQVDIRSDLYSLGCTLYTLLTGRPPFSSGNFTNPLKKVLAHAMVSPTKIQQFAPEVPSEFCDYVEKLMAKDPQNRFAHPSQALESFKQWTQPDDFEALLGKVCGLEQQLSRALWSNRLNAKKVSEQNSHTESMLPVVLRSSTWLGLTVVTLLGLGLMMYVLSGGRWLEGIHGEMGKGSAAITGSAIGMENRDYTMAGSTQALPLREGYYRSIEKNLRTKAEQTTGIIISGKIFAYTTPDKAAPGQLRRVGCLWRRLEGHPLETKGRLVYVEEPEVRGYLIVEYESSESFRATCWRGDDFTLEEALEDPSRGYFHSSIEGVWFSPDIRFAGPAIQLNSTIANDWREFIGKIAPQCLP